jgi:hypothetical protein
MTVVSLPIEQSILIQHRQKEQDIRILLNEIELTATNKLRKSNKIC